MRTCLVRLALIRDQISPDSWEDAAKSALSTAAKSLRDLRVAEVTKLDMTLDDKGQVSQYRTKLTVSFKFEGN